MSTPTLTKSMHIHVSVNQYIDRASQI